VKLTKASIVKGLDAASRHLSVKLAAVGREALSRPAVVGPMGLLLNAQTPEGLEDDAVHPFLMALEHARASETQGAGSMRACVAYARRAASAVAPGPGSLSGRPFTRGDVPKLAAGVLSEDDAAALVGFVAEAGASRYIVERAPSRVDNVEFVDSYEFKHASKAVDGVVVMDGARVLVADGYIETVAEIHAILDRCGREGERLIICGRGFSDDVAHTLAVNRARGTLVAYALTFPFDADDANTLVDVASIVGGDVVSSLKGQLYTNVDASTLPRAPYARLRGQTFDFRGEPGKGRVAEVLLGVQDKLAQAEEPMVRETLERRVRRLSGACMIVRLADGIDHLARVEAWDLALRSLRAATRGVVDVSDREAWPDREVVPLDSVATAHEMARKLVNALESLDSYV
jgi:hypothetical protein